MTEYTEEEAWMVEAEESIFDHLMELCDLIYEDRFTLDKAHQILCDRHDGKIHPAVKQKMEKQLNGDQ